MALTYGEVLRPPPEPAGALRRRSRLLKAAAAMREGIAAADAIMEGAAGKPDGVAALPEVGAERDLWEYSAEVLEGVAQWLEARTLIGEERRAVGVKAIARVDRAARHVREIDAALKGAWGIYDFERMHGLWLERLRRRLDE
jgi:hypothetical protein